MDDPKVNVKWKPFIDGVQRKVDKRKLNGIYSEGMFSQILQHERNRSDRLETSLSIVFYDFNNRKNITKFIETLKSEVRFTDHLGWTGKNSIGVILTGTDRRGAEKFIAHFHACLSFNPPIPRIYSYPENWENANRNENAPAEAGDQNSSSSENQVMFVNGLPVWKRVLDITGSLLGLMFLTPLFVLLALYIKIVSPGPVFYKQKRVGQGRRVFTFIKFRTMKHNNNEQVHSHHAKDFINFDRPMEKLDSKDPRIIFGGKVLRKSCIDELPQLLNILKGDMSLVGPRPCIPYEADEYGRWHGRRFSMVPGLTGLWQVSGKNKLTFKQMIKLDIAYEKKMSLGFDLAIIFRTIPTVFNLVFEAVLNKMKQGEQEAERYINREQLQKQVVTIDRYPEANKYSCSIDEDKSFAMTE